LFAIKVATCFLLGYGIISAWRHRHGVLEVLLATVLGIEVITSIYAVTRFLGSHYLHYIVLLVGALFGAHRLMQSVRKVQPDSSASREQAFDSRAIVSGIVVMVFVGSTFYFSGRSTESGLTFFGPMSRDHALHLAWIGRLEYVVPPDNFMISGFPGVSYHFFTDLAINLFARDMGPRINLFDVYFRLYPGMFFFCIGFFAFWVPSKLFASCRAGAIGAALILFGGDPSWVLGMLQALKAVALDSHAVVQKAFGSWFGWSVVSSTYSLIHRPAQYSGILLSLAGLATAIDRDYRSTRSWIIAGLIWGLMAGFNYHLAAVIGIALVISCAIAWFRSDHETACRLALCAAVLALASTIANFFILGEGNLFTEASPAMISLHSKALFRWAPSAFLRYANGWILPNRSGVVTLIAALIIFMVMTYGLRLFGLWSMLRGGGFRFRRHAAPASIVLIAFVILFLTGMLFVTEGRGLGAADNIIFFQPTAWMLALFATYPLTCWSRRHRTWSRPALLAFLLLALPVQAFLSFNLGNKVVIKPEVVAALERIKRESATGDVIAFLPDSLPGEPILGPPTFAANYFVSALTGLKAYFSVRGMSELYSYGDTGPNGYDNRFRIINNLMSGQISNKDIDSLITQGVKWVLLPAKIEVKDTRHFSVWMSAADFTILRVRTTQ
jgi:hypothetical protein